MATRRATSPISSPISGPKVPGAAAFLPVTHSLKVLADAVQSCKGCELYRHATQAVFGETIAASKKPRMMMVGEQPGDREDREGHPFVGPAGKLLDRCLEEAGIERGEVYVTNAVKHFKWEPRGKLRIHKKPSAGEIFACRPWLEAEVEVVKPELIVCLGATAVQSLLGPRFRVSQSHGKVLNAEGRPPVLATVHPSSILRAISEEDRHRQTVEFIEDLRNAEAFLQKH